MLSSAQVTDVANTSALATAFMSAPRSQCDFEEISKDLGDAEYFKRAKITDCEQEDCPSSVAYAPPRKK